MRRIFAQHGTGGDPERVCKNTSNLWTFVCDIVRIKKRKSDNNNSGDIPPHKQIEIARTLIEIGKSNGLKKMTLTVGKDVGASLGGSYVGAIIKGVVGLDGKLRMEVEY
jgi:hypothetical protein